MKRTHYWLVIGVLTSSAPRLATQSPQVRLGPAVPVSADSSVRHAETVIAVNPRDPRNIVVAAIELRRSNNTAIYVSHDGGRTWDRGRGPDGRAVADTSDDPSVTFDDGGQAFFLARGEPIRVRQSGDGGKSWDAGVPIAGRAHDRPWLLIDRSTRRLFILSKVSIFVPTGDSPDLIAASRSTQAVGPGVKLEVEGPRLIFLRPPSADWWLYVPSAYTNGPGNSTIAAAFECDQVVKGVPTIACRLTALPAPEGGWRFGQPVKIADVNITAGAVTPWLAARSGAGGRLATDRSAGSTTGRVYAIWAAIQNGRGQLFVASSADTGRAWSSPVIVSLDSAHQANPGIAVNADGTVGVVWNDWRGDASGDCFRPFFAASVDGGRTFTRAMPLTSEYACTATPGGKPEPERFANGGDTFGIAAAADGAFHVAWIGGAKWRLTTTRIDVRR